MYRVVPKTHEPVTIATMKSTLDVKEKNEKSSIIENLPKKPDEAVFLPVEQPKVIQKRSINLEKDSKTDDGSHENHSHKHGRGFMHDANVHSTVGCALVTGFVLMLLIDQLAQNRSLAAGLLYNIGCREMISLL